MFDFLKKKPLNSRLNFQLGLLLVITTCSYIFPFLFYLNYILLLNIIFLLTETLELNLPKHLFTKQIINRTIKTHNKPTPLTLPQLKTLSDTQNNTNTQKLKTDLAYRKFEQNIYNIISSCVKNPSSCQALFENLSDKGFILVIYKTSFSMCTDDINLGRFLMNVCNSRYQFFEEQVGHLIRLKNGSWWYKDEVVIDSGGNGIMRAFFEVVDGFDSAPDWVTKKLRTLIE